MMFGQHGFYDGPFCICPLHIDESSCYHFLVLPMIESFYVFFLSFLTLFWAFLSFQIHPRASFYHGAKIRNSAVLPLAGNLLGSAFPKPCFAPLRAKKLKTVFVIFQKVAQWEK